jgi:hypothetical protein
VQRGIWNVPPGCGLVRLDVGGPDHLAPLFGFLSDQLAEVSRRTRKHRAAEIGEPRLHRGIGESRIDLLVECVDDLGGRVPGCAEAAPRDADLICARCRCQYGAARSTAAPDER